MTGRSKWLSKTSPDKVARQASPKTKCLAGISQQSIMYNYANTQCHTRLKSSSIGSISISFWLNPLLTLCEICRSEAVAFVASDIIWRYDFLIAEFCQQYTNGSFNVSHCQDRHPGSHQTLHCTLVTARFNSCQQSITIDFNRNGCHTNHLTRQHLLNTVLYDS